MFNLLFYYLYIKNKDSNHYNQRNKGEMSNEQNKRTRRKHYRRGKETEM